MVAAALRPLLEGPSHMVSSDAAETSCATQRFCSTSGSNFNVASRGDSQQAQRMYDLRIRSSQHASVALVYCLLGTDTALMSQMTNRLHCKQHFCISRVIYTSQGVHRDGRVVQHEVHSMVCQATTDKFCIHCSACQAYGVSQATEMRE